MKGLVFLLLSCLTLVSGQQQMLKYVLTGRQPSNTGTQFTSATPDPMRRNVGSRFQNAERVCVVGMWALYNNTDYSEGYDDLSMVISVKGTTIEGCTAVGQLPRLKEVRSLRFLGSGDYGTAGTQVFSQPQFLGGVWAPANGVGTVPTEVGGVALGSMAITGPGVLVICQDLQTPCNRGVCVNMRNYGNLFILRDASTDTSVVGGTWPKTVRQVLASNVDECQNYPISMPPGQRMANGVSASTSSG